ncbi:hypothetical protein [Auraticoccus monumenti]|uniref:Uncharacterized protein n=1 Tax=Auraticoccus monumenti TaxID=675864 RepID=A0A1G6XID3_9ACTN|nr:hypothetical protein [Auraticoccus monumenti]SDD77067.1 hypothetical protein SAMN04489747_1702 [Auraticoccus monumenti]
MSAVTFASVLAGAVERSGTSLTRLHAQLRARGARISLSTLSHWRSGHRLPDPVTSQEVLPALEELLELPSGHLRRALQPRRRVLPLSAPADLAHTMTAGPLVQEALDELGMEDWANGLQTVSAHSTMDVDADGRPSTMIMRSLDRATRTGIDRRALVIFFEQPMVRRPRLRLLAGAHEGRLVSAPEHGFFVTELLFTRPLLVGETVLTEHQYELPPDLELPGRFSVLRVRPSAELVLWVRFHPDAVPARCETVVESDTDTRVTPLDLRGASSAHLRLQDFGPGKAMIRWSS